MNETAVPIEAGPPSRRIRSDWPRRLLNELFALFVALLVLFAGTLILLDTAPGHRFIVDRIGELETASGLRIHIGRIDGSTMKRCPGAVSRRIRVPAKRT